MKKKIIILGCMDTKGQEYAFIKDIIEKAGCDTLLIDVGVIDPPMFKPDKDGPTRDKIAPIMTEGAKKLVVDLVKDKKADGIISLGGTQGTSLATNAMRELPVGFPKVMVSTMASGDTFKFVGLRNDDELCSRHNGPKQGYQENTCQCRGSHMRYGRSG